MLNILWEAWDGVGTEVLRRVWMLCTELPGNSDEEGEESQEEEE
jgi:hypothetical protein